MGQNLPPSTQIWLSETTKPPKCQYNWHWLPNCSEYGGSFEAGAGTLRLYVHAVALARAAADAAQQAMEREFQAIDALKERLQVIFSSTGPVLFAVDVAFGAKAARDSIA